MFDCDCARKHGHLKLKVEIWNLVRRNMRAIESGEFVPPNWLEKVLQFLKNQRTDHSKSNTQLEREPKAQSINSHYTTFRAFRSFRKFRAIPVTPPDSSSNTPRCPLYSASDLSQSFHLAPGSSTSCRRVSRRGV